MSLLRASRNEIGFLRKYRDKSGAKKEVQEIQGEESKSVKQKTKRKG